MLIGFVENFFESFNEQLNEHIKHGGASKMLPVAVLFVHVQDNEKTISVMFKSESGTALMDKFKKYWIDKSRPIIDAHLPAGQNQRIPMDMLTSHVVNTLFGLVAFWIQDGLKHAPEQMEQYFYKLIVPVLSA